MAGTTTTPRPSPLTTSSTPCAPALACRATWARQYSSWFAHPGIFEEFEQLPFGSGGRWDAGRLAEMEAADHAG